jgi:hypothetical protein
VHPGDGGVSLFEQVEDAGQSRLGHAAACVGDDEADAVVPARDRDLDATPAGEFRRVVDDLVQRLTQTTAVGDDRLDDGGIDRQGEGQTLAERALTGRRDGGLDHLADIRAVQRHLVTAARQLEQILHQVQHGLAAPGDRLDLATRFGAELRRPRQQVRIAGHAGQRRAHLVAHQGEEARLGHVGLLRPLQGGQGGFGPGLEPGHQTAALGRNGRDRQGRGQDGQQEEVKHAQTTHHVGHARQRGIGRDLGQDDGTVAGHRRAAGDDGDHDDRGGRPGRRQAEGQQHQGRQDQEQDRRRALAEHHDGRQAEQTDQSRRLPRPRHGVGLEAMVARQQQQRRRDDHHRQQFHAEQVVDAERQAAEGNAAGGQGDAGGQQAAQRHSRNGDAEGEARQAAGPAHVQGGAAEPARHDGGDGHLHQVQRGVDDHEHTRIAAH